MTATASDSIKWIPFGVLVLLTLTTSVFWKIEKSREQPLRPVEEVMAQQPPPSAMEGKPAPLFTLPALDGGTVNLADYRGKMVFLNIWATWCAPCREEMPAMQRLADKLKGVNFAMVTVSIDKKREDVEKFVRELGLTFTVALDPDENVSRMYQITGVPETFLISPDGIVMHHVIGPGEWDNPNIVAAFTRTAGGGAPQQ